MCTTRQIFTYFALPSAEKSLPPTFAVIVDSYCIYLSSSWSGSWLVLTWGWWSQPEAGGGRPFWDSGLESVSKESEGAAHSDTKFGTRFRSTRFEVKGDTWSQWSRQSQLGSSAKGEFHDQADAKWIVIRRPLRGHLWYTLASCQPPAGLLADRGWAALKVHLAFPVLIN
jgi:hypothetical protein